MVVDLFVYINSIEVGLNILLNLGLETGELKQMVTTELPAVEYKIGS